METPFYHDDAPPVASFGQLGDYDRYPGNKMIMSKKGTAVAAGGHHFIGGGSGSASALKLSGNPDNLGLTGTNASLVVPSSSSAADVNLLKLASPDLEHLIVQSNQGLVTTTNSANPFLYRNQATNEQEGFADGFVKALADLHKQNQLVGGGSPMSPSSSSTSLQAPYQRNLMSGAEMPVYANLSSYNPGQMAYPGGHMAYGGSGHSGAPQPHSRGPDAPQTVPEVHPPPPHPPGDPANGQLPSLSPIDPETQERIKAERKKLRNRIAASKCRKRKLERISRLEEKVKALKTQNSALAATASTLREQVTRLKRKVTSHVAGGCQIAVGSAKPGSTSGENSVC
ncbi:junE proto-oncogene, AP-1 transcription factor subunit [Myripristis murdjan]|uniref:junE proto-oncogene, AP-1 transcription factor subunit n=1 Tax=Myripristis murdjan TaxID=586833 RepID=UPI0011764704|nr:transcription factor jun-D-like [Myripristis murdjan]